MSRSRVSRMDLPLSILSTTASRREFFWTSRASAYKCRARAWPDRPRHPGRARSAAATAASTSAVVPCDTRAITAAVDGSIISNVSPPEVHSPSMKCPNPLPCDASHLRASASDSGAGPYSMVSKISRTVVISSSWHRHPVGRRVAARHEVLELPLDVGEQRTRAEPEEIGAQPPVAELILHQVQVLERRLRRADPAGGLEAHRVAGALVVFADHATHHEGEGQRCVHSLFSGRGLDEVGPGLHRHDAGARHVASRPELAGGENRLHVGLTARLAESAHFIVERLVVAREHVRPGDDDVDLARTCGHRCANLRDPFLEWAQAGGKPGG